MSTLATNPSLSPFLPVGLESGPPGMLEKRAAVLRHIAQSERLAAVRPASRLEVRPKPEMISTGIPEIDALDGGIPRGCLTEIFGSPSSGKTSVLLATIAAATQRGESCVLIDASDSFDPVSAAAAGTDFNKLLWVRCGKSLRAFANDGRPYLACPEQAERVEGTNDHKRLRDNHERRLDQVLKSTDLILQSGGFGLVALDLAGVPEKFVRRIPLASWFRFQRAVEHTKTALLVISEVPCAQTCAALVMKVCNKPPDISRQSVCEKFTFERTIVENKKELAPGRVNELRLMRSPAPEGRTNLAQRFSAGEVSKRTPSPVGTAEFSFRHRPSGNPSHTEVLKEMQIEVEVLRSRLDRKPMQSVRASFSTQAVPDKKTKPRIYKIHRD
jgi:recA bacterial DNA recombination protein